MKRLELQDARHEAVHAVTAVLVGAQIKWVRLYDPTSGLHEASTGGLMRGCTKTIGSPQQHAHIILAPLAFLESGPPSALRGGYLQLIAAAGGYGGDLAAFAGLGVTDHNGEPWTVPDVVRACRKMLLDDDTIAAIDRVARALYRKRRLSGGQVRALVKHAPTGRILSGQSLAASGAKLAKAWNTKCSVSTKEDT